MITRWKLQEAEDQDDFATCASGDGITYLFVYLVVNRSFYKLQPFRAFIFADSSRILEFL